MSLDVLGCWIGSFEMIVIRVQWQPVLGIARYSVLLQGGMCKTGSRGKVIVDAVHEYSWDIFPVVLVVFFFHMGWEKGDNCV